MTKQDVLNALTQSTGQFVSGQELSRRLGVSRAAVCKAVGALCAQGFVIESRTNKGYRMVSPPDRLSADGLRAALGKRAQAHPLEVLDSVSSTNTYLKRLALEGAPDGTVVLAEQQTGGRGRFDRVFHSPPGKGIYLSLLLRPALPANRLMVLTAFTAVAVCRAIEQVCGLRPQIKWTNDLLLGGKKLCGILTELSLESETARVQYAVVGVGINVNQEAEDFPPELSAIATSLKSAAGRPVSRELLIAALLAQLDEMMACGFDKDRTGWLDAYRAACMTVGQAVTVERGGHKRLAQALSIDEDAALVVRYEDGSVEAVNSGEVSVRGLYGHTL